MQSLPLSLIYEEKMFIWSKQCDDAANYLKKSSSEKPRGSPQFQLIADASGAGIGAALFQVDKVVAYEGRKYRPAEVNYTVGEQELLAVVNALHVWRCCLEGASTFQVVTDHNPLI